jgi:RNA polymerase sigma-70 factor, ECF subfamily
MVTGMVAKPAEPSEDAMRAACLAGDYEGATTATLRRYGPELFGFLVSMHRGDHDAAGEAFSLFSEKLWQSMSRFEWECSLRTWCYRLVHNAGIDVLRGRKNKRHVGLSSAAISKVAAQVRTSTMSALRTEKRSALEQLRDELPEEDRALLILRVDRGLEWREVALVLATGTAKSDALDDDGALKREAARLRKRFQLVVERLRAVARERKLIEG